MKRDYIYRKRPVYTVLKPAVDWNVRHCYRKVEIRGEDNLPSDGPIIFAANHCNTLMDALVILRASRSTTVFGARADMFNSPFLARIMHFLRILPMVRQRDGLRNVLKNVETQDLIVEILENDVRFCMFPEGRHRPEKSLLPIGKGIFRIALAANAKFGETKPVYIVPTGLEYGDFFRYRSTSLVTFGRPINVTEFVKRLDAENEAKIIEALRKELTAGLSELFTFIPDGEHLKEKWTLTKMISIASDRKPYGNFGTCLHDDMMHNREIILQIEQKCSSSPEKMNGLLEDVREFEKYRRKDGISIYSFRKTDKALKIAGKSLAALIGLPYFIFSAAASLPMWVLEKVLRTRIKDKAFRNTASFGIKLALGIIWFVALAITAFCLAPWYVAAAALLLAIPTYSYFHDYLEGMRRFISDIRIIRCKKLRKRFKSIIKDFNRL